MSVLDHIGFEVSDLERSVRFCDAVFDAIGGRRLYADPDVVAWGVEVPQLWLTSRGQPAPNFGHVALRPASAAEVRAAHAAGWRAAGTDAGDRGATCRHQQLPHPNLVPAVQIDHAPPTRDTRLARAPRRTAVPSSRESDSHYLANRRVLAQDEPLGTLHDGHGGPEPGEELSELDAHQAEAARCAYRGSTSWPPLGSSGARRRDNNLGDLQAVVVSVHTPDTARADS